MNQAHDKYMIKNKIKSLNKVYNESGKTILHLNRLVSQYVITRDNEIKKREKLAATVVELNLKLDKLEELEQSKKQKQA